MSGNSASAPLYYCIDDFQLSQFCISLQKVDHFHALWKKSILYNNTYTCFVLLYSVCILLKINFHVFHGLDDTLYFSYWYSVWSWNQIYMLYPYNGFGNSQLFGWSQ